MRKTTQLTVLVQTDLHEKSANFLHCQKRIVIVSFSDGFSSHHSPTIEKGKSKGRILGRDRLVSFLVVDYKINRILLGVEFNSFIRKCYGF